MLTQLVSSVHCESWLEREREVVGGEGLQEREVALLAVQAAATAQVGGAAVVATHRGRQVAFPAALGEVVGRGVQVSGQQSVVDAVVHTSANIAAVGTSTAVQPLVQAQSESKEAKGATYR